MRQPLGTFGSMTWPYSESPSASHLISQIRTRRITADAEPVSVPLMYYLKEQGYDLPHS